MRLQKYKTKDPKKIGIKIFTIVCILLMASVFLYTSFASFETKEEFNIINGEVQDPGDLYFVFYVNDVISKTMPQKGEGYKINIEKTTCNNGANVEFNEADWSIKVLNMTTTRTKCTLYFEKQTAVEYILSKGETDELKFDKTVDNNLRYIGANPNNYVSFNNELWRIIGVMNNVDDGTGTKETRLKIISEESIGKYSWDNKASGTGSSTSVYGSSNWKDSTLQQLLNEGAYWNRTTGDCPYGQNGATIPCDFSNNGLTSDAKQMIDNTLWNLGKSNSFDDVTASMFYERERGTTVNDGWPIEWIGKVGLMYPSDYGYATSGGTTTNRDTCLNIELYNWQEYKDCYSNNWLNTSLGVWTLTSLDNSILFHANKVFLNGSHASSTYVDVMTVVYLKSNVKITSGEGSKENPYILSL